MKNTGCQTIYERYKKCVDWCERAGIFTENEKCYKFLKGEQWDGLKYPKKEPYPPVYNIIKPIINEKASIIAESGMTPHLIDMSKTDDNENVVRAVTKEIMRYWEINKIDFEFWKCVRDAATFRAALIYYYFDTAKDFPKQQRIDIGNFYVSDPQQQDLQEMQFIIIAQRLEIEAIKKIAKENGNKTSGVEPDSDTLHELGEMAKIELDDDGKALMLTQFSKDDDGFIHIERATKDTQITNDQIIAGMRMYPFCIYRWEEEKGSTYGRGEVVQLISNQIAINRAIAINLELTRQTMTRFVYDRNAINTNQIDKFLTPGGKMGIDMRNGEQIGNVLQEISGDSLPATAYNMPYDIIKTTRELSSSGDVASINPELASGAAIVAVDSAIQRPLNYQRAGYEQFGEDNVRILFDQFIAYHPNGIELPELDENGEPVMVDVPLIDKNGDIVFESVDDGMGNVADVPIMIQEPSMIQISQEDLMKLDVQIRVDISSKTPYSKYASEQNMLALLLQGQIDFYEFVDSLDDDSTFNKSALEKIAKHKNKVAILEEQIAQIVPLLEQSQQAIADGSRAEELLDQEEALKLARQKINDADAQDTPTLQSEAFAASI